MGILGRHEAGHYMPEDGILVVRDVGVGIADELSDNDAHPVGTIARSGHGWLYAAGGDGPCVVHLQLHDERPGDDDLDAWDDVVEVPFESLRGVVELSSLMSSAGDEDLRLGEPGMYRVRVAHRALPPTPLPDDEDDLQPTDLWHLDFWQVAGAVEPPRWFRRRRPPVSVPDPGWTSLLGLQEIEVANVVEWAGKADGMTVDEIATWGTDHYRGPNWLDQSLRNSHALPGCPNLADIARQVGVRAPRTRRDLLPLYVGLRILTFDGTRYVAIDDKPMAQDVLRLPVDVVTFLEASQAVKQFTGYAADLVSVALWGGTEQTVASLAERTLADEDDVRATLRYAEDRKLLQIEQRPPDKLSLTPHSRR